METPGSPVAWCTTPAVRQELEKESFSFCVNWTTPEAPFGDDWLAVLDTRAFPSLHALVTLRRARPSCPVLVVCAPEEVSELAAELQASDDIVLQDAPVSLLKFRVHRLGIAGSGRDSLTFLFNRSVFIEALQGATEDPERLPASLLLVDIDAFKAVNDRLGHHAGDEVLKEVASRLARVAPSGAVVARLGGDEFGILATLGAVASVSLAEQLLGAFKASPVNGIDVTVSIGCATAEARGQSLFRPADEALYGAKAKGRNRAMHYDEMARRAREQDRDPAFESFENRTRVIAERIAEMINLRGRRLFEGLKEQADVDGLTGLFGRRYLDRRLPFEVEVASEREIPLTVALLDIDHFGAVNKTYGWPTGDKVLTEVADRIRRNTRADDWVARYGGEEFCVVMHGTALEEARPALERIRTAVAERSFTTTDDTEIHVTMSGGIAQLEAGETREALMERASRNLLTAKSQGRNRLVG